jgi:hypothetical protein
MPLRNNGIVEVTGSIPVGSTNTMKGFAGNDEALFQSRVRAMSAGEPKTRPVVVA